MNHVTEARLGLISASFFKGDLCFAVNYLDSDFLLDKNPRCARFWVNLGGDRLSRTEIALIGGDQRRLNGF